MTTHEIEPEFHIKIQAVWQKYFDNAVSKTINFPRSATIEDVKKVYISAWKLGCKGITIYRDGSKQDQVLSTKISKPVNRYISKSVNQYNGNKKNTYNTDLPIYRSTDLLKTCPDCGSKKLESSGGCLHCPECGWSACKI